MGTIQASFDHSLWESPMGETHRDALRLAFRRIYSISLSFFAREFTNPPKILVKFR